LYTCKFIQLEVFVGDSGRIFNPAVTRRTAFRGLAGFLAGSPLLVGQQDPFHDHSRVPALSEMVTAFDFEAVAQARVAREGWDYLSYGVDGEFTLRRNREAFDWVALVPRRLIDPGKVQTESTLLGTKLQFPMLIAPSRGHVVCHPDAEAATHAGATAAHNTPFIISNNATVPVDEIAKAGAGPLWFQLYPQREADYNRQMIDRAQAAGCQAIVVTIDQQASSYERAQHDRHLGTPLPPPALTLRPAQAAAPQVPGNPYRVPAGRLWAEWKLFDELRRMTKLPLLAKGILTPEDAVLCLDHGVDAVYVSNHGGRSLDYGPSTFEVLPEIADAIHGRVPIILDSGIRRGTDILKALALGASAVGLGRAALWGLAAYGPQGLQKVLEILQAELVQAMAATGRPTLASIDRSLVRTEFV
jgi:4-hydroxymandelate oxidase